MLRRAVVAAALCWSTAAHAAHPLITDDTGTQGKERFQIEVNSEFGYDKETVDGVTTKERASEIATVLSVGVSDTVDVVLGMPYQWVRTTEDGVTSSADGLADLSLEVKWRLYEKDGLGFAVKPGVTLPTGDDEEGLGTGRATYSLFLIGSKEAGPWAFHANLGYIRNDNKADERKDIWHASLAASVEAAKDLTLVGNIGIEGNPDRESNDHPAFVLGGLIYSLSERIDIDAGVKWGLNKAETDYAVLAGLTVRF